MKVEHNMAAIRARLQSLGSVASSYGIPRFIVYWKGKTYDNAPADYDGSGYVGEYRLTTAALAAESTLGDSETDSLSSGHAVERSIRSGYYFILHPDVPSPYSFERWGCMWAEVVTDGRILPVGTPAFRFDVEGRRIVAASQERLSEVLSRPRGIGRERVGEMRVRNVDMAREMVEYAKNNILQQAAQAMLAQANGANQGVLQLLG